MRTTRALAASFLASLLIASSAATAPASVAPSSVAAASTTTARVTKVVDGDTIRTTKGTIRLIGVDTPETGRCNAARATAKAKKIAPVGSKVTLTRVKGENNTDRYGRYLRYVSRNGVDLGGAQIKAGLADARYDSLEGYPHHPKQGNYRRWDAKYPDKPSSSGSSTTSGSAYTVQPAWTRIGIDQQAPHGAPAVGRSTGTARGGAMERLVRDGRSPPPGGLSARVAHSRLVAAAWRAKVV